MAYNKVDFGQSWPIWRTMDKVSKAAHYDHISLNQYLNN
jgi:hypothetical protein